MYILISREIDHDNYLFGYSGSSLPSCPSLSLDDFLYREDFPGLNTR